MYELINRLNWAISTINDDHKNFADRVAQPENQSDCHDGLTSLIIQFFSQQVSIHLICHSYQDVTYLTFHRIK